jgi:hypothetical protein
MEGSRKLSQINYTKKNFATEVFSFQKQSIICVYPKISQDKPSVISTVIGGVVYLLTCVSNSVTANYLSPNKK